MLRVLGLILLFPVTAMASELPAATYGTPIACETKPAGIHGGLAVSSKRLVTPEVRCETITKTPTGYRAQCSGFEPSTVKFTVYMQEDGSLAYADDYWGSEVLHRCP